ncbi:MAG: dTMP kinase [Myxococcales bacterium]|nr:dTMP kinase [Myxococcales bacterium]
MALEGIDGSGTTTQTARLVAALREAGIAAHATCEPSAGPVGALIRQILAGRVVLPPEPTGQGARQPGPAPSWASMALLFAADRLDHLDAEVLPALARGRTVVTDRYDYSSVAYQSMSGEGGAAIPWLRDINRHARRPDLTLVLDIDPSVAAERRALRGGTQELYERAALQQQLAAFYADIDRYFPVDRFTHVDASASADVVAAKIWRSVRERRAEPFD